MPPVDRIRNIAVGLVVREGHALVEIYPATERHEPFARALGGGVEFGETAAAAVRREFLEELGIEVDEAVPLAVTENIFDSGWAKGHEVVHVFLVRSAALDALALSGGLPVLDNHTIARWVPLADLRAQKPPFYPVGMIDLAEALDRAPSPGRTPDADLLS